MRDRQQHPEADRRPTEHRAPQPVPRSPGRMRDRANRAGCPPCVARSLGDVRERLDQVTAAHATTRPVRRLRSALAASPKACPVFSQLPFAAEPGAGATIGISALVALVVAAFVSGGVKALLDFLVGDQLARRKANRDDELSRRAADRDYTYARRKALDDLVGEWRGRLIQAAMDMHVRMRNLYTYDINALDRRPSHLYRSTVFRFLALFHLVVAFERQAIYFEPDISRPLDRFLAEYSRCFTWVITDVRLFDGSSYDRNYATEHFFTEQLAAIATSSDFRSPFTWTYFNNEIVASEPARGRVARLLRRRDQTPLRATDDVFAFLERLPRKPLAWDRMVSLHLLLRAFLDAAGYEAVHHAKQDDYDAIAAQFRTEVVPRNLPAWLDRQILDDPKRVANLKTALQNRTAEP
jgi:hypothetical protein